MQPRSRAAWRKWLERHHASSPGVWLVYAKKGTGIPSLSYNDAVEEALCFGWIDSVLNPIDERLYMQRFTPRKPRSVWSKPNKERVARMIDAGLMTPRGLEAIERAKEIGTWDALTQVEALAAPPELRAALDASATLRANWEAYSPSARKQFLYWLAGAKREATRARRVEEIVELVAQKITLVQARTSHAPAPARARRQP